MADEPREFRDLAEMVREGERVLDIQGESYQQQDEKSQQAIGLGLGSLGGLFAIATFLADRLQPSFDVQAWRLITLAGVLNIVALLFFIDAYIGLRRSTGSRAVVPGLPWLCEKAASSEWTLEDHYLSLLEDFRRCFEINTRLIARRIARRRQGVVLLLLGLTAGASAFLYVLRNSIVA